MALGDDVHARLPGPAPGDVHRSRGGVGRADPRAGDGGGHRRVRVRRRLRDDRRRATRSRPKLGHVTIVVDRATRELVGAAMACPDASAAIHECVLAIKAHVPVDVLADTIHAFPSTSRIFNGLFADARKDLAPS